jgi:hypothetical protein
VSGTLEPKPAERIAMFWWEGKDLAHPAKWENPKLWFTLDAIALLVVVFFISATFYGFYSDVPGQPGRMNPALGVTMYSMPLAVFGIVWLVIRYSSTDIVKSFMKYALPIVQVTAVGFVVIRCLQLAFRHL